MLPTARPGAASRPSDPQTLMGKRGGQFPVREGSALGPGTSLHTEGPGVGFAGTKRAGPDPPGPVSPRKPGSALNLPCCRHRSGDGGRHGTGASPDLAPPPRPPREHLFWSVCPWRAPRPRHHGVQGGGPLRRGAVPRRERRSGAPGPGNGGRAPPSCPTLGLSGVGGLRALHLTGPGVPSGPEPQPPHDCGVGGRRGCTPPAPRAVAGAVWGRPVPVTPTTAM